MIDLQSKLRGGQLVIVFSAAVAVGSLVGSYNSGRHRPPAQQPRAVTGDSERVRAVIRAAALAGNLPAMDKAAKEAGYRNAEEMVAKHLKDLNSIGAAK